MRGRRYVSTCAQTIDADSLRAQAVKMSRNDAWIFREDFQSVLLKQKRPLTKLNVQTHIPDF